jgi:DNA-binding CsgD family transcriptional regulator
VSVDVEGLFAAFGELIGKQALADAELGEIFRRVMRALVRFDHIVVFAYNDAERPIDLYSTFNRDEHVVFVALYQVGPYLLDPFYHTARQRREGVFRMRELAPDRFFSSEYYRTYYVKTGLAEEIGFFVPTDDGTTVVLSLMRREESGSFPTAEFSLLRKAEPMVAALVRHHWAELAPRFSGSASGSCGRGNPAILPVTNLERQGQKLSMREAAIVELVLQGHSSESIGLKLGIATGTVKVHRRNVYRKLDISSQTQLFSLYLKSLS